MLAAQITALLLSVTGATGGASANGAASETVLLDFRADWCGPCRAMEPVVHQLSAAGYPVRMVNIDQDRALAAKYHIGSIPCFVLVVDGREVDRTVGQTDPGRLQAMFSRAGYDPSAAALVHSKSGGGKGAANSTFAADAPDANLTALAAADTTLPRSFPEREGSAEFPATISDATPATATDAAASPSRSVAVSPLSPSTSSGSGTLHSPLSTPIATPSSHPTDAQLLAACVRLKIADSTGNSYGSGTIIDVRHGEALILTCAHVFRESDGKGEILVDLYGPDVPRQVHGRLIGCDLERDVGLVSITAPFPVSVLHVAPSSYTPNKGDQVFTIGCSNGAAPTIQTSHVDSLERFRGPPNLQVAGQPVQGRSGGGLVNADGLVIGVCNAADPEDNEGLYAAQASIYKELDRAGVSFVYQAAGQSTASTAGAAVAFAGSQSFDPDHLDSGEPPAMPSKMPVHSIAVGARPEAASPSPRSKLSPDEAAALSELRKKSHGAEVICIVRPTSDPTARSEIIVLDKASPEFLEQLAAERRARRTGSD